MTDEQRRSDAAIMRWAIAHQKHGTWRLTLGAQGRRTYATREAARTALALYKPQLVGRVLTEDEGATLRVVEIECWPRHFDPKGRSPVVPDGGAS